ASTLLTPPALKLRWAKIRPAPPIGEVEGSATRLLEAALDVADERPSQQLLEWVSSLPPTQLRWDEEIRARFVRVLHRGNARSWRFLSTTGFFDRALPELADVLAAQEADPFELEPMQSSSFRRLEQIKSIREFDRLLHSSRVLISALILDTTDETSSDPVALTRKLVKRMEFDEQTSASIEALVTDANLFFAASRRPDAFSEEAVLQLAAHLDSAEQATALFVLTLAAEEMEDWERERAAALFDLTHEVLSIPELTSRNSADLIDSRRAEASALASSERVRERLRTAPRALVLNQTPQDLVELAALCERDLGLKEVRVKVNQLMEPKLWAIAFVSGDRVGLMARETAVMTDLGYSVVEAVAATWADGCALSYYKVETSTPPDVSDLRHALEKCLGEPLKSEPLSDVNV
ncbi:MAG: hypothetical protein ACRD1T_17810, partial [Acidimicrobiia bacterium]